MSDKIIGITVGTPLPKPNFKQDDPTKGDYIKNRPDFDGLESRVDMLEQTGGGSGTGIVIQPDEPIGASDGTVWLDTDAGGANTDFITLLSNHTADKANPHGVTAEQIGAAPADLADYTPYNGRKNFISNLLHIDLSNPDAYCNKASVIATEDASTLIDSPVTSGAFYAYREVLFIDSPTGGQPKCIVRLTQSYPFEGVIWTNIYDPNMASWSGWNKFENSTKYAPAGLSLYDVAINSEAELETALTTAYSKTEDKGVGFARIHVHSNALPLCGGSWFFTIFRTESSYGTVFGSCYFNDDFVFRNLLGGEWGEWEFSNPPMYSGVEYRTTERWNGKAVYTKLILVSIDTFADYAEMYLIPHNISNFDESVSIDVSWLGYSGYWRHFPGSWFGDANWSTQAIASPTEVNLEIGTSAHAQLEESTKPLRIVLRYTKTTY